MPVEHLHVNFLFISMHFALEMGMVSYKNRNGYVHESFIYIYIYMLPTQMIFKLTYALAMM